MCAPTLSQILSPNQIKEKHLKVTYRLNNQQFKILKIDLHLNREEFSGFFFKTSI